MKDLVEELYLTNRGFVTDDYDDCLAHIDENELPLTFHEYESGSEIWDSWVIPDRWHVHNATLETTDGRVLVDFDDHPLHLISYSDSFQGEVTREELIEHLHWHPDHEKAIPWHYAQNYRPWNSEWGFCVPKSLVDELDEETYYVDIDTEFEPDMMTVAEHHLSGQRDETILLVAHLDHTGMANDDLAGVACGIELINRLREYDDRTYSYKLLLVQEMIGSAAYLADETTPDNFEYGIFLEMLGNDNRLLLQRTFEADTRLDRIAQWTLDHSSADYDVTGFRESVGNDELVLESPGYEIPTVSLSRFPYSEYHTHLDDPSIISEARMESAVEILLDTLLTLDRDVVPVRQFTGLPSLANPKYDLYLDPQHVAKEHEGVDPKAVDRFRDRLFRHLEGNHSAFDITEKFDLPVQFVRSYLEDFAEVGLVELTSPFECL